MYNNYSIPWRHQIELPVSARIRIKQVRLLFPPLNHSVQYRSSGCTRVITNEFTPVCHSSPASLTYTNIFFSISQSFESYEETLFDKKDLYFTVKSADHPWSGRCWEGQRPT